MTPTPAELAQKLRGALEDSEHTMHELRCEVCDRYMGNRINLDPIANGTYIPSDKRQKVWEQVIALENSSTIEHKGE